MRDLRFLRAMQCLHVELNNGKLAVVPISLPTASITAKKVDFVEIINYNRIEGSGSFPGKRIADRLCDSRLHPKNLRRRFQ